MEPVTSSGKAKVSLPTDEEILITREFDAPKHLVYRAWTTPELVKRWWSGQNGEVTLAEIDLRVGGAWRYAMLASGGLEVAFHGEYREIVPNQRIVYTEVFEGTPDAQIDLDARHLAALPAPPALDQLRRGPGPVHEVLRRVERPRDEDLLIGRQRHRRGPVIGHRRHLPAPLP